MAMYYTVFDIVGGGEQIHPRQAWTTCIFICLYKNMDVCGVGLTIYTSATATAATAADVIVVYYNFFCTA